MKKILMRLWRLPTIRSVSQVQPFRQWVFADPYGNPSRNERIKLTV